MRSHGVKMTMTDFGICVGEFMSFSPTQENASTRMHNIQPSCSIIVPHCVMRPTIAREMDIMTTDGQG